MGRGIPEAVRLVFGSWPRIRLMCGHGGPLRASVAHPRPVRAMPVVALPRDSFRDLRRMYSSGAFWQDPADVLRWRVLRGELAAVGLTARLDSDEFSERTAADAPLSHHPDRCHARSCSMF